MLPAVVSPRLSALLGSRVDNPECEQPVTLMAVRRFFSPICLPAGFNEAEANASLRCRLHRC